MIALAWLTCSVCGKSGYMLRTEPQICGACQRIEEAVEAHRATAGGTNREQADAMRDQGGQA